MSTYYILVNPEKKEWIDSGDLGLGLKEKHYQLHVAPLLGYLMLDPYGLGTKNTEPQYDPKTHILEADDEKGSNFSFAGHWAGNEEIQLVSEHRDLYDSLHGYGDDRVKDQWVNISEPLARDWNYEIKYWYGESPDMQDWIKHNTFVYERTA